MDEKNHRMQIMKIELDDYKKRIEKLKKKIKD